MADKVRIEAANEILTAETVMELHRRTGENINQILEKFLPSRTNRLIYDLQTTQRFLGPYALAEEYLEEIR